MRGALTMLMRREIQPATRRWVGWALFLGAWAALAVFDAVHAGFRDTYRGKSVDWGQSLAFHLCLWYAWALLSPAAWSYTRRFPFSRSNWWHRLPLTIVVAVSLTLAKLVLDYPLIEAFYCPASGAMPFLGFLRGGLASHFHTYVMFALGLLGVLYAWHYFRAQQMHELRAWQLEAQLAQAQLQLLRIQLHPHFLFNILHGIATLVRRNPDEAERMLARLGELLRYMLDTAGEQVTTLRQELTFLRAYLDIEQVRFGSRLNVSVEVDPHLLESPVPPLILQPLVENSIRHGIAHSDRSGHIEIRAQRVGSRLRLEVWDDGPGLAGSVSADTHKHIGLANTRARLEQLFGDAHCFEVRDELTGVRATLEFPAAETPFDPRMVSDGGGLPRVEKANPPGVHNGGRG